MDVYLKSAKIVDLKEIAQIAQGLSAVVGTQLIRTEDSAFSFLSAGY